MALQKRLGCDILKIETRRKRNFLSIFLDIAFNRTPQLRPFDKPILRYEHFVFLGPVWAGKIASPLRSFLRAQRENIKRYAFITVCGSGEAGQKERIIQELTNMLYSTPEVVTELGVDKIMQAKQHGKPASVFRINATDLDIFKGEIDRFVDRLNVARYA